MKSKGETQSSGRMSYREAAKIIARWNARPEDKEAAFKVLQPPAVQTITWQEYRQFLRGEFWPWE